MPKKYRSGFERLARSRPNTDDRYRAALQQVRENFKGFDARDGFDARKVSNFTDSQKHQIRRYYNLLREYVEGGPVYKMRPSELPKEIKKGGTKNVDAVMRAAQMPHGRKRAKYIFIKYDGETIPRVSVKDGAPVFINDRFGYARETIELNKVALATDATGTILSIAPHVEGARFFRILNGRHEFFNAGDLKTLARKVEQLQQKYAIGSKDSWDKWLHGVAAYYTEGKIGDLITHLSKARDDFRKRMEKENRKLKRKRK